MNNFKFRTNGNTALSAGLQAVVFELGGRWWSSGSQDIEHIDSHYFYLDGGELTNCDSPREFDSCADKEIDLSIVTIAELVDLLTPEPELYVNVYKGGFRSSKPYSLEDARTSAQGCLDYREVKIYKLVRVDNDEN